MASSTPEQPLIIRPLPKRWQTHHPIPADIDEALQNVSPLLRQLLYNRGIQDAATAAAFLDGSIPFPTDPFLLVGMKEAVARLHKAVTDGENIAIYGDYDADGVTSSALLKEFLDALGVEARAYIPDRYDEGYGLNEAAIRQLAEEGIDLIITVDCGVRAMPEIQLANELGMDVIVTDHHHVPAALPPAVAVIDPKQEGDPYPEKNLAGVGLAYKLAQAYLTEFPEADVDADHWLDLVAIGTVVDLAPLRGENRVLVKAGLEKLRQQPRQGIFSLAQVAGVDLRKCDTSDLGFRLGPRLNAAGRLESALTALNLLTSRNLLEAGRLAQELDTWNSKRQDQTEEIRERSVRIAFEEDPEAILFFAADPGFSEGVVGLAASRLVESFYRPSIVGHEGAETTVASCRSIPEFHITRALDDCADLLVRHGGHAAAAGLTVRNENREALVARLREIAQEQLGNLELLPMLDIDRTIKLDKLNGKFISGILNDIRQLEPTGRGNPEPVFASYDLEVRYARAVGREGSHLKLRVRAGKNDFDAIAFRQGYWLADMPERIDLAYRFEINEFNGRATLQLNVKDIRAAEEENGPEPAR
jgi:single-stranded-DNA-specific exonuclease